jgi:Uma2 family endonuclease
MTPIGRRHMGAVDYLNRRLNRGCGDRAIVRVQGAIRLSRLSEPEPDLLLLKARPDFYRNADAGPPDVLLLVEVAEPSLDYDRGVKIELYNRFAIPEVWLVDLRGERVAVYRTPSPETYRDVQCRVRGEHVAPAAFPEVTIPIDEILG